jgi:hypothetical protein
VPGVRKALATIREVFGDECGSWYVKHSPHSYQLTDPAARPAAAAPGRTARHYGSRTTCAALRAVSPLARLSQICVAA